MLSLLQKSFPKSLSRTLSLSRFLFLYAFLTNARDLQEYWHPIGSTNRPARDSTPSMDDLLFRSTEYPAGWDNGQDPDDYKPLSAPLNPQFVFNNSMLWYRASFKIEYKYLPMSFCQFSARKLLQAKTSRMGLDHRAKIVTSSFDVVDNDEFIGGANLVKEFGGIIYTGTS